MNLRITVLGCLAAICSLSGCATDEGSMSSDDAELESAGQPITDRVVASIDLGYGKLEFHSIKGDDGLTGVYALETHSAYLSATPLDDLMGKENPTNLELFMAVAPGQAPPQELIDSQASEAEQRERETGEVRSVHYDSDAPVQKGTAAACSAWAYAVPPATSYEYYTVLNQRARDSVTGIAYLAVGDTNTDYTHYTQNSVSMGICNESTSTAMTMYWQYATSNNGTWYDSGTTSIPALQAAKQFNLNLSGFVSCSTPSNPLCLQLYSAKYRLVGQSTSPRLYRMRTVELVKHITI